LTDDDIVGMLNMDFETSVNVDKDITKNSTDNTENKSIELENNKLYNLTLNDYEDEELLTTDEELIDMLNEDNLNK